MRKIRYAVAMSLDGYVAGPNGEADWIVMDPEINFSELWAQFDTLLMGRRTYETAIAGLGKTFLKGTKIIVVSRELRQSDHPEITIINELNRDCIQTLRSQNGKDIWLFGGGRLFRSMLEIQEVDTVEVSVVPVLLGGGVSFLPPPTQQTRLRLSGHKAYGSGLVSLTYDVQR
ncbi:dihydrofolate reductase family protein [Edaphobacter modestus]|uniref:Dihydrofolate reductase n=1 Tax=Edaphobacter modestus TaxID=388466 RepID=A0A4Q7YSL9_9BACT|nr:dihydrofolate reductase family protein [Edaphobacter modestus]RZU40548.1 dihydrofolate reductase [Edaphobacter modestus]